MLSTCPLVRHLRITRMVYVELLSVLNRAVSVCYDVPEAASARDHGQHMLDVRRRDLQQVGPLGVQHLPDGAPQLSLLDHALAWRGSSHNSSRRQCAGTPKDLAMSTKSG
eukprot:GHUV01056599.1.p1 GENE.GHUV01056599.1~~GHUV01056599.1.p1  ORF type:complete len:110 (-),score=11.87 GHUV01056599.1:30-359(-)